MVLRLSHSCSRRGRRDCCYSYRMCLANFSSASSASSDEYPNKQIVQANNPLVARIRDRQCISGVVRVADLGHRIWSNYRSDGDGNLHWGSWGKENLDPLG